MVIEDSIVEEGFIRELEKKKGKEEGGKQRFEMVNGEMKDESETKKVERVRRREERNGERR